MATPTTKFPPPVVNPPTLPGIKILPNTPKQIPPLPPKPRAPGAQ